MLELTQTVMFEIQIYWSTSGCLETGEKEDQERVGSVIFFSEKAIFSAVQDKANIKWSVEMIQTPWRKTSLSILA